MERNQEGAGPLPSAACLRGKANLATLIVFLICGLLAPAAVFSCLEGSGTSAPAEHELSPGWRFYNETELPVGEILSDREDPQFADVLFEEGGVLNMRRIPPGHLVRKRLQ